MNTPPKLTDDETAILWEIHSDECGDILMRDRHEVVRAIESARDQQWVEMLSKQEPVEKRDLLYATVAMQEREAQRIENIVGTLEQIKQEKLAMLAAAPQPHPKQEPVAWPDGLIDRIKAAEQRIQDGHALRRIPADPTDVDLVLAEVRYLLEGKQPPFWIKTAAQPQPCNPAEDGVCEALECCKHGVGDGACKECHDETARPSQDRRADALLAQQERDTALLRQALEALENWEDMEKCNAAIAALRERLK